MNETKPILQTVKAKEVPTFTVMLASVYCEWLEEAGGNLGTFARKNCQHLQPPQFLFFVLSKIEAADEKTQNRWLKAIERGKQVRLELLQLEALDLLEDWDKATEDMSASAANGKTAWVKMILSDVLAARIESSKRGAAQSYLMALKQAGAPVIGPDRDQDVMDDLERALTP